MICIVKDDYPPEEPGIYWVQAFDEDHAQSHQLFRGIPRVNGRPDPWGVLYIGRTHGKGSWGKYRLKTAVDAFYNRTIYHQAAAEYLASGLVDIYPELRIWFCHVPYHEYYDCVYHETALLVACRRQFGEYLPLNIGAPE